MRLSYLLRKPPNKMIMDWISVKDKLPEKYGYYIIHMNNGKIKTETWNGTGWAYAQQVTYWMPLPEPPTE